MKKKKCYNDLMRIRLKKGILVAVYVLTCVIIGGFLNTLTASAANTNKIKIVQQQDDMHQIPDKYSTGPKGSLQKAEANGTYGGIAFKQSYKESTDEYTGNIRGSVISGLESPVTIENYDFSGMGIKLLEEYQLTKDFVIKFKNCKFNRINTDYEERRLKLVFENCSIVAFRGSNAEFYNCSFGGSTDDAMHIYRNVIAKDCYFSDMSMKAPSSTHVDGVQIFGDERINRIKNGVANPPPRGNNDPNALEELVDVYNIDFSNCRFEIPDLVIPDNPASVNACFSLSLQYSSAANVFFKDSIVNGGSNTLYGCAGIDTGLTLKNIVFDNVRIGGASRGAFYPNYNDNLTLNGLVGMDALYIGSVWKDNTGIHLSVTNDTTRSRVLKIVTDRGVFTKTIGAAPDGVEPTATSFAQLPIDIKVSVPKNSAYVVCLDATEPEHVKQIRFVNYSGQDVYISPKLLGGNENLNNNVLISGNCGNDVRYTLSKDYILTISGNGDMQGFDLKKGSPTYQEPDWYLYRGMIKEIYIEEGVTRVGGNAFKNCFAVSKITLPDSLTRIETNAFANCSSLINIRIPDSLPADHIKSTAFLGTRFANLYGK